MSLMLNTGAMQYKPSGSSSWQPLTLVANVDLASLADEFSTSSTYAVGEYVRRGGLMYRCITAITTAGAWDSTKWTEVNIGDEIAKDHITVKLTITANGSVSNATVPGMTAEHVLDSIQFYTDSSLSTPSGTILADVTWTPAAGKLSVTVANKVQNCYALLGFSYKPIMTSITIS